MAEEFDVFALSMKPARPAGGNPTASGNGNAAPAGNGTPSGQQKGGAGGNKRNFQKFNNHQNHRPQKVNNSPIRGANGAESVNPLLNAPLPTEQRSQQPEAPANPNRDPSLPEYRLADIQTWPAPVIVERMMPGADPEELGTYRKHELIFAAIRAYLAKGGAVQIGRASCRERV